MKNGIPQPITGGLDADQHRAGLELPMFSALTVLLADAGPCPSSLLDHLFLV